MTLAITRRGAALAMAAVLSLGLLMSEKSCDDGSGNWRQVTSSVTR